METTTLPPVATVSQVETPAALIVARHQIITPADLAAGGESKRTYVLARIAAGETKAAALAEFETALAEHRVSNKAALAALATLSTVVVARVTKTKTGWTSRLIDTTAATAKAAAKAAALVEKYRAKIATLEAAALERARASQFAEWKRQDAAELKYGED